MVFRRIAGLFRGRETEPPPDLTQPAPLVCPERALAVGDLHGRRDLLDRMIALSNAQAPDSPIIFVGDYIDRGEESAAVLGRLMDLTADTQRATCLMGNHESMALDFLDDPEERGGFWLRNGGLQTLASFGVGGLSVASRGIDLARARDELVVRMGAEMIAWLRSRPLFWQSGNVGIVHAAADPSLPLDQQERRNLLWGHRDFRSKPRSDGLWIVHGHTIVPEAAIEGGRIAIDTGAYATGRLSGVLLGPEGARFLTT